MKKVVLFGSSSTLGLSIVREYSKNYSSKIWCIGSEIPKNIELDEIQHFPHSWKKQNAVHLEKSINNLPSNLDIVIISLGYMSEPESQLNFFEIKNNIEGNLQWPLTALSMLMQYKKIDSYTTLIILGSALSKFPVTKKTMLYSILKNTFEDAIIHMKKNNFLDAKILLVRPSYIPTKLNSHLSKGKSITTQNKMAKIVVNSLNKDESFKILYVPQYLLLINLILNLLPNFLGRIVVSGVQKSK
ncbi:MAG: hypothetical protein EBS55_08145 [Flavobacteriaceae bacterium]|nr:hypothetical protein [Flavobacteriaceae bacterium]